MSELATFDQPMKTSYCIDLETRDRQLTENLVRIPGRIQPGPETDEPIAIVCFGPSLEDTWEQVRAFKYVMTCSGAHRFLIDRGIVPTWHAEVDPRKHKAKLIGKPHKDVKYLCASVCHREVFDLLEGHDVKLWHVFSNESSRNGVAYPFPRGEWSITGGSNVGLRSMVLARFMGFRKMTVFGMDYSFKPGRQHAGPHPKEHPKTHFVEVGGVKYETNPAMHQYAQQFFTEVTKIGNVEIDVRGEGLLQAVIREKGIPKGAAMSPIAATCPDVISPEYRELSRQFHQARPDYGTSGSRRLEVVAKLIEKIQPKTILDYGCGKGTLAAALPMAIWEYDPAIPGKDAPPRAADLVVCTDVLEHVEPEYLEGVLLDLSRVTLNVCYCVVHTGPAMKSLPDGRNAHLIQQPMEWWKARLGQYLHVASATTKDNEAIFVLGPKPKEKPAKVEAQEITPFAYRGTEVRFFTPNEQTAWRAKKLDTKEPATMDWIEGFQPGETMIDVGANVGGYSVWAGKHRGVKVYAFEPEASNYALLCRNLTLNQVDGQAYCAALTDGPGLSTLWLSTQAPGASCHSFGEAVGFDLKPRKGIPQGCVGVTLDSLGLKADHVKIDVDGFEHKVVAGGRETIGRAKSVLVEVNPAIPEHLVMLETLKGMGFTFDPAQAEAARRKDGPFKGCAEYVFRKPEALSIDDQVIARLRAAPVIQEPFPHLYVEDVFPADFFAKLCAEMPPEGACRPLEEARGTGGYPERFVAPAPACVAWMRSGKLRAALDAIFGTKSDADESLVLRDRPGYSIPPHTDTPRKVITALFYVNRGWTEAEHGTAIYRPLTRAFEDPQGLHHDRAGFERVWAAPGKPNSALIFARTNKSFHGCEPYEGSGAREILLYDTRA